MTEPHNGQPTIHIVDFSFFGQTKMLQTFKFQAVFHLHRNEYDFYREKCGFSEGKFLEFYLSRVFYS